MYNVLFHYGCIGLLYFLENGLNCVFRSAFGPFDVSSGQVRVTQILNSCTLNALSTHLLRNTNTLHIS